MTAHARWREYKPGELVQLKSGGAPLTIDGPVWFFSTRFRVHAVTSGGLIQRGVVDGRALIPYAGPATPHVRRSDAT